MASVNGRLRPQASVSTFPRTATTGAIVSSLLRISGPPTSPAWRIRSEPRSARTASSRSSPCVSDINPRIFISLFKFFRGKQKRISSLPKLHFREIASPLPNTLTISSAFTRARSTCRPQCRCGPVTRPVAPTFPKTVPATTSSPTFASISEKWQ